MVFMMTYTIPVENLETLQAKIAELAKRAARIAKRGNLVDCTPISIEVGELFVKTITVTLEGGVEKTVRRSYYPVTVTGAAPKLAGWSFIAALTHEKAGTIIRRVPGTEGEGAIDLTAYRNATTKCDHCQTSRRRNDTFVVCNTEGELKQIGRQCLKDFTGHENPLAAAKMAELLMELAAFCGDAEEGEGWGGGQCWHYVAEYLPFVAHSIRKDGWLSRTNARAFGGAATADTAMSDMLPPPNMPESKRVRPEAEDYERAATALEWARTHLAVEANRKSDYEHNLWVSIADDVLNPKAAGLVASVIPYYTRAMAEEMKRRSRAAGFAASTGYAGEVGKRQMFENVTLERVFSVQTDFGALNIHKFRTATGEVLVWKTCSQELELGTYNLKGTVKKHDEYKGDKQTTLSRCTATLVKKLELAA